MELLSEHLTNIVLNRIRTDGVSDPNLQNSLLDHYCCIIEQEMDKGIDFEQAYSIAWSRTNPGGMAEIQEELFFLLTFKKQLTMQKIIYGCGFAASFGISMGFLFKIQHWPGAMVTMTMGFGALLLTSLGLLYKSITLFRKNSAVGNLRAFAGLFAAFFIASGSLFKMFYFPTANTQILLGMLLLNLVFMPLLFWQMYRNSIGNMGKS